MLVKIQFTTERGEDRLQRIYPDSDMGFQRTWETVETLELAGASVKTITIDYEAK